MSEGPTNEEKLDKLVQLASGVVAVSENRIGIRKAMELVGFNPDQIKKMSIYQRVRRRAQGLLVPKTEGLETPPASAVRLLLPNSEISSLTSDSQTATPQPMPQTTKKAAVKKPTSRRSAKDMQRHNAVMAAAKGRKKSAMKAATTLIKENKLLPSGHAKKKSITRIVKEVNANFGSNVSHNTAARYVRKGLVGTSPLKTGPMGDFPKHVYTALKGAYTTYLKLEQAGSKKQSTIRQLAQLVNATVNHGGFTKTRDYLTRKLQKDTADEFEVGKANVVEHRRLMWTTAYNLDVWFNTFKEILIELGFARPKTPEDGKNAVGELVFFAGQLERIGNIDETDGSIDDTTGNRGGRPPVTFYSAEVSGGATAGNKSGYSSTIICGSNAAGDPFPPHFQLKTMAQTEEGQRMSVNWFEKTHSVIAKFGFPERQSFPCTYGMNEKAGMNAIELDKYIKNSILPLYPDIADEVGKRVILKVDSGPGRMNVEMLASLRLLGLYVVPGVPNTTSVTQETDQNYGPFKGVFRGNIRLLSQARFDKGLSVLVTDLPLLVFGGTCNKTGIELRNAFQVAFSVEANLASWRKCGAVPLTRLPLNSKAVRHEVPVAGATEHLQGISDDEEVEHLRRLESMNAFFCDILAGAGYDGTKLRKKAPTREKFVAVTKPNSKERVAALKKVSTAGQMFYATGGGHVNSDSFFVSTELKVRDAQIKVMEDTKKDRAKYCKDQLEAVMLIRQKGDLDSISEKKFTLPEVKVLLKWKKVKVTATKKRDLIDAYIAAPKPKIQKVWCNSEEAALVALKEQEVPLKETRLGTAAKQMATAVGKSLEKLDQETMDGLKTAILTFEESKNPNAI